MFTTVNSPESICLTISLAVREIRNIVHAAGGRCFAVGGAVRDHVMGKPSKDMDLLVTGVPMDLLISVLSEKAKVDLVGRSFGVLKITLLGETVDVALPRTEKSTGARRGEFEVFSDHNLSAEADLSRRDLTMNAIAVDLMDGTVVDPHNGLQDIREGRICAVGDPRERFNEDSTRMLRAIRFIAKTGFQLDGGTEHAIADQAHLIRGEAVERVWEEIRRMVSYESADYTLQALRAFRDTCLLEEAIPEFAPSIGFEQKNPHHEFTVDEHVFQAVWYAVSRGFSVRARLAALLHDIAKPATFTEVNGHGHFFGHEDAGAVMVTSVLTRMKATSEDITSISKIVGEHLRPQEGSSDRVLRRYIATMGDLTEDGMACRESDLAAHARHIAVKAREIMDGFRERLPALDAVKGFGVAQLALRGDTIAREFRVNGKGIGDLKKRATAAVIDGLVPNEPELLLAFLKQPAEQS